MRHLACLLPALFLGAAVLPAREEPAEKLDPKAVDALRDMARHLSGLKGFSVEAEETTEVVQPDKPRAHVTNVRTLDFARPDRLRWALKGDTADLLFVCDGKRVHMADNKRKACVSCPARGDAVAALSALRQGLGVSLPWAELLSPQPDRALLEKVQAGRHLGRRLAGGMRCQHLTFSQPNLDWQIWVEAGEQPWPRKLVISPHKGGEVQVLFKKWAPAESFPAERFAFTAPEGFRSITLPALPGGGKAP